MANKYRHPRCPKGIPCKGRWWFSSQEECLAAIRAMKSAVNSMSKGHVPERAVKVGDHWHMEVER